MIKFIEPACGLLMGLGLLVCFRSINWEDTPGAITGLAIIMASIGWVYIVKGRDY